MDNSPGHKRVKLDASSPPQPSPVNRTFDDQGDLTLIIGSGCDEFKVCSRSVTRHSRVFRAMLCGNWSESRPAGTAEGERWTVSLPDDNSKALMTVLSIVHGNFRDVPKSLTMDDFYEVLVITDKYDMLPVLHPYSKKWFDGIEDGITHEKKLFIAWELGQTTTFQETVRGMVTKTTTSGGQLQLNGRDLRKYQRLDPPGIIDGIADIRAKLIAELLGAVRTLYHGLMQPFNCGNHGTFSCREAYLGCFVKRANQLGLFEFILDTVNRPAPEYHNPVNILASALLDLKFTGTCKGDYMLGSMLYQFTQKVEHVDKLIVDRAFMTFERIVRMKRMAEASGANQE